MIKLIYGEKGTGKTKQIIDEANLAVESSKGDVVFITDTNKYMFNLKHKIRLVDANEFEISSEIGLLGFIRGLIAANADIQYIYIDGAARIAKKPIADMENFYNSLEQVARKNSVTLILTVSESGEKLPLFLKRFI